VNPEELPDLSVVWGTSEIEAGSVRMACGQLAVSFIILVVLRVHCDICESSYNVS
jgi:hypothetical protein